MRTHRHDCERPAHVAGARRRRIAGRAVRACSAARRSLNRPLPERWTGSLAGSSMTICVRRACRGARRLRRDRNGHAPPLVRRMVGVSRRRHRDRIPRRSTVARRSRRSRRPLPASSRRFRIDICTGSPGYNRYFVLLAMFVTGMLLVALAGNVEVLFIGWEFVGLSSALLVAFFHERPAPVSNALRVFSVYRISDAAMLSAAVLLRHVAGTDSLVAPVRRRPRGVDGRSDRNQRDDHRRPPHRGRRRQERAAAVLGLAPARDGGTDAVERRLLRIALDSRRMLPAAAVGAAARTRARGPRSWRERSERRRRSSRESRRACRAT